MKTNMNVVVMSVLHDEPKNLSRTDYVTGLFAESRWLLPQGSRLFVGPVVQVPWQPKGFGFTRASVVEVWDPVQPVVS